MAPKSCPKWLLLFDPIMGGRANKVSLNPERLGFHKALFHQGSESLAIMIGLMFRLRITNKRLTA